MKTLKKTTNSLSIFLNASENMLRRSRNLIKSDLLVDIRELNIQTHTIDKINMSNDRKKLTRDLQKAIKDGKRKIYGEETYTK